MSKKISAGNTARKVLWLLLAAVLVAAGINLLLPGRVAWVEDRAGRLETAAVAAGIRLEQLSDMIGFLRDGSRLFVDARSRAAYEQGHLPEAVSVPYGAESGLTVLLKSARPPVVYCSGSECSLALDLAKKVRDLGRTDVAVFIGGMELWQAEMLPVEEGK